METKAPLIKQGWLRAIIGLPLFFIVVRAGGYIPKLTSQALNMQLDRLYFVANDLIFLTLGIYLVRRFFDKKSFSSLGFTNKGALKDILISLIASFAIMGLGFAILYALGNLEIKSFDLNTYALLKLLVYILIAASLEELSMRGYMLTNMLDSMNRYLAVAIISVIFGLIHGLGDIVSPIGILNTSLLGAMVGLYYVQTRSLWMPVVFHAAWNYFQGVIFGFKVSGVTFGYSALTIELSGSDLITGGEYGLEGSLILTAISITAIVSYEIYVRKQIVRRQAALNQE